MSLTFVECELLSAVYLESELADPLIRDYLSTIIAWATNACGQERYFLFNPCSC